MKRASVLLFLCSAFAATAGLTDLDNPGPAVTSVAMRQRYPWNGFVDVDVTFEGKSGETYRIELSATDKVGGTNLPVRTAWLEGVPAAVGNPVDVPAPGTHRLVWNAGADLPAGFVADRVTVTAKLLNPIWSFASIPDIDPDDEWAPETVYHDVQTVAAYGEIEDHEPTVRCLTDEWNLESSLGANVVFSGASMGLRPADAAMRNRGVYLPIALWAHSESTNAYRMVTMDYETGVVAYDSAYAFSIPGSDLRFFSMRDGGGRAFADLCRGEGHDVFLKSANTDTSIKTLDCRYADAEHGSAVCGYFPNGIPWSDSSSTAVSSYDKGSNAAVFFSGEAGTDMKEAIVLCGGSAGVRATSKYSCMGNPVGRYVVPLLDGNTFFTVVYPANRAAVVQHFALAVGKFSNHASWDFVVRATALGYDPSVAWSKGVAMPDGRRIFLGGAGRNRSYYNGSVRMWQGSDALATHAMYPYGHPFESWARRDVTCLLPNGKFCGVDEELGLVVVNPLTGETYVASDDPAFKKGKMGCQLLPNGKVWIIPYDCEGREFAAGTNLCGKLYEVDFGFTRSFSLSSLCSPYLRVAEGDPEPSGIKVGLDPNGGELPGIYAMYYKGENPVYGELPVPTWIGHTFLGWSTDGTEANLVAATDPVPPLGILLKAAWQANGYSVKFNANGGSGSMSNQSFTYGVAQALTANAFTRTGYTFGGWATSATGAKVYNDKQSVSNLTVTAGGTVNLYAVWTKALYMVIDLSGGSSVTSYPVSYLSTVPSGGWTDEYKTTKLVLRRIDAGTFTMGSPTSEVGRYDNETQHSVTLTKDYFIGVFEVTQRQWELVMGTNPSYFSNMTYYKTRPVEQVCFNDIRGSTSGAGWPSSASVDSTSFIGRIRARTGIDVFDLPTEAQWERACRAGTTTAISNGRNLSNRLEDAHLQTVARYAIDWTIATQSSTTSTGTAPVGSLQANPWGLYDMHGNVWEWCLDRNGTLGTGNATDPKGASSGTERVFRGGAWDCMAYNCRSARRGAQMPSAKEDENEIHGHYGLRVCCGVQ